MHARTFNHKQLALKIGLRFFILRLNITRVRMKFITAPLANLLVAQNCIGTNTRLPLIFMQRYRAHM